MRLILTLMAMAVLAISTGCDKKPATPPAKKDPPKPAGDATGDKTGDSAKADAPKAENHSNAKTQTVSLKLPGMT